MLFLKIFSATFVLLLGFGLLDMSNINVNQQQMQTPITIIMLIAAVGTVLHLVAKLPQLLRWIFTSLVKMPNLNSSSKVTNQDWEQVTRRFAELIWNTKVFGILPLIAKCDSTLVIIVREHIEDLGEEVFEQYFHLAMEYVLEDSSWQRNQYGLRSLLGRDLRSSRLIELAERQRSIREKRFGARMALPMLEFTSNSDNS